MMVGKASTSRGCRRVDEQCLRPGDASDRCGTVAEGLRLCLTAPVLDEGGKGIDWDWENRRGVVPGGNFNQGLQVTELQSSRIPADHVGGIGQALRRFEFTLRMDDFGSPLTFRFGLLGDHTLHILGKVHVFHLDRPKVLSAGQG